MSNWLKTTLLTAIAIFVAGCSGDNQDQKEEFNPQPGGKCCEKQPEE